MAYSSVLGYVREAVKGSKGFDIAEPVKRPVSTSGDENQENPIDRSVGDKR